MADGLAPPLPCEGCGETVALDDVAEVRCPRCGEAVAVPDEHREALRREAVEVATRVGAHRLYGELGAAPGLAARVAGVYGRGWWLVAGSALGMFAISRGGVLLAFREIGYAYHVNALETVAPVARDLARIPPTFALVALGAALAGYARRRALSRLILQASLSATSGTSGTSGTSAAGARACRVCGAPMLVPFGALGVRCVHCHADNLVALPPALVDRARPYADPAPADIEEAAAEHLADVKVFGRAYAIRAAAIVAVMAGLLAFATVKMYAVPPADPLVPPAFTRFEGEPRPLLRRQIEADRELEGVFTELDSLAQCPVDAAPITFDARDCAGGTCTARLYAALHGGERAAVTLTGLPTRVKVSVRRHLGYPWPRTTTEPFGPLETELDVLPGAASSFVATWTAWHELAFDVPSPPPTRARVCLRVTR